MEDEEIKGIEEIKKKKEYNFANLPDRRAYFHEHPEIFPELLQKFVLSDPQTIEGVNRFVHKFAQGAETRHEAHWHMQTYLLWEIWQLLKEFMEGKEETKAPTLRRRG